jgi:hypothetical protein
MERQLSLMSPAVEVVLGRTELETLAQGLRRLIDEAAASRDECEAMGMREMAAAAEKRQRELGQLEERLLAALATLD